MKFDLESRLKYIYTWIDDPDYETDIVEEIGKSAYDMLRSASKAKTSFSKLDKDSIKQACLKHKREKEYAFGPNDYYYSQISSKEMQAYMTEEIANERMFNRFSPGFDFLDALTGYTTTEFRDNKGKVVNVVGSKYESRRSDLMMVIQQYIKNGYNPYHIMNYISKKTQNSQDKQAKEQGDAINQVLESCVKTHSPYRKLFDTAEQLGKMINETHKLESQGFAESADYDKIDDYRDQIRKTLAKKKFDKVELEEILSTKTQYLKGSEKTVKHNSNLYQGLTDMYGIVQAENQKRLTSSNNL